MVRDTERVSACLRLHNVEYRITNIYAPNSPSNEYFQRLSAWLANVQQHYHVIGEDFNSMMDGRGDR